MTKLEKIARSGKQNLAGIPYPFESIEFGKMLPHHKKERVFVYTTCNSVMDVGALRYIRDWLNDILQEVNPS